MTVTDEQVFEACAVYEKELAAWRVFPVQSTGWNDKGRLKYHKYYVTDDCRWINAAESGPITAAPDQLILSAEVSLEYPKWRAMKAALESIK